MGLTYTDYSKTMLHTWGRFRVTLLEAVAVGDLLSFYNTDNAYTVEFADQSDEQRANCIACQKGSAGDVIWACLKAEVKAPYSIGTGGAVTQNNFAASADWFGAPLYLGEDGKPSSTVGTTFKQEVGKLLARDRVLLDLSPTLFGDLVFNGVGSSSPAFAVGVSGTPISSAVDDKIFFGIYLKSTGGSAHGLRIELEKTSATAGAPRVLTLRAYLKHASGHAPSGANCVDAQTELETGNTGISGEAHAMESKMRVAEENRVVQGTYACHKFTNQFKTGNTMPATTFFHRYYDVGPVYTPLMFDFSGLTAGTAYCIEQDTGAQGTPAYYLRVKMPNGSTGYICILGDHS